MNTKTLLEAWTALDVDISAAVEFLLAANTGRGDALVAVRSAASLEMSAAVAAAQPPELPDPPTMEPGWDEKGNHQ
jgi:hypothetical protein